jgi:hypothetical protein
MQIRMQAQSQKVVVMVQKPSASPEKVRILVFGQGEQRFDAAYTMAMYVEYAGSAGMNSTSWPRIDAREYSFCGQHVVWSVPMSTDSVFAFSREEQQFALNKEFEMEIRLDCGSARPCIGDGDVVSTVLETGTPSSPSSLRSKVTVTAQVISLIACEKARVWLEGGVESTVVTSVPIRLRLSAFDVDGLPIRFRRLETEFRFGEHLLPVQWCAVCCATGFHHGDDRIVCRTSGSNEYIADVASHLTANPGGFDLVVTARNGWSMTNRSGGQCELLRRTITVQAVDYKWIIVGASVAAVALLLCLGIAAVFCLRRHQDEETKLAIWRRDAYDSMRRLWDDQSNSFAARLVSASDMQRTSLRSFSDRTSSDRGSERRRARSVVDGVASRAVSGLEWLASRKYSLARQAFIRVDAVDSHGYIPLHYAVSAASTPIKMVEALVAALPRGLSIRDAKNNLALHLAIMSGADLAVIRTIYAAYPEAVLASNMDGALPMQLVGHFGAGYKLATIIELTQLLAFPLDCQGRCENWVYLLQLEDSSIAVPKHGHANELQRCASHGVASLLVKRGGNFEVAADEPGAPGIQQRGAIGLGKEGSILRRRKSLQQDDAFSGRVDRLVSVVLDVASERSVTIEALAYAKDSKGRLAIDMATLANKRIMWQRMFLLGRYQKRKLLHQSATSRVWEVEDKEAEDSGVKVLALKQIQDEQNFIRESSVRAKYDLSDEFVVQVVRRHPADRVLLMPYGDCSLEDATSKEHFAGMCADIIRSMRRQLCMSTREASCTAI